MRCALCGEPVDDDAPLVGFIHRRDQDEHQDYPGTHVPAPISDSLYEAVHRRE